MILILSRRYVTMLPILKINTLKFPSCTMRASKFSLKFNTSHIYLKIWPNIEHPSRHVISISYQTNVRI